MRSHLPAFVLALTLAISTGSLLDGRVVASPAPQGCCVCFDCGNRTQNATMMGRPGDVTCSASGGAGGCEGACFDCGGGEFFNVTCSDPSLAETCGESNVMAPTASPAVLVALVALLAGFGAFYLRRRRT